MKHALLLLPLLSLAACHSPRTKDWYVQHDAERKQRVAECKNDAAQTLTPDCKNAISADDEVFAWGKATPSGSVK